MEDMEECFAGWGASGEENWVKMSDGCEVLVRKWEPKGQSARGVLHLCHGMAEHSARYGHVGDYLAQQGFRTYAADHRAHGQTAERAKSQGSSDHWHGHCGTDPLPSIIEDHVALCLRELEEPANKGLPFIIFGHSMGSVIATLLSAKETVASRLSGLVLSGCPARPPVAVDAAFGPLLAVLRSIYGGAGVAPLIRKLTFEKFNAKFAPNTTTDDDWLNRDPVEVKKYVDDPWCGFSMSVDYWRSFRQAFRAVPTKETLQKLPDKLPTCILVGAEDPAAINDFGRRSSQQIEAEFAAAERRPPKVILYGGARHEISMEFCREEFASDLVNFLDSCCREATGSPSHSRM